MNDEGRRTNDRALNTQYTLELHIEELVLHGFAPSDRYRIAEAVERELAHLFAQRGIPPLLARGGEIPHLDGGSFEVAPDSTTETIGARVSQTLYGELNR